MPELLFEGRRVSCAPRETVLAALLRAGIDVPYSCRRGICLTCTLRAVRGPVPAEAQAGLKETLRAQGHFLACLWRPEASLEIARPEAAACFGRAKVRSVERLGPRLVRVRLAPAVPLYYHAGQFINLRRADGLVRSYSLASVPRLDDALEIHVRRMPGGRMSTWICDKLASGVAIDIEGPHGSSFYVPGRPSQPLLLIGTGSGLGALSGVARDALADGHEGPIVLYHGSRHARGLYLAGALEALAARHPNFRYHRCVSGVSGAAPPAPLRRGRAEEVAFADHDSLAGWRVFLVGCAPMVHAARRRAYLAGAALEDILADPFELRELRRRPRHRAGGREAAA